MKIVKAILLFLCAIVFCCNVFSVSTNDKEKFVAIALSSLSQEALRFADLEINYVIDIDSEEYATYLSSLTKVSKKDIYYIKERLACNLVLNKNGNYSLREAKAENKNDWRLIAYNKEEYFSYNIDEKFGCISNEMPNYSVPTYADYIAKMPQVVNIPKFWRFYKDFLTNKSVSLETQGNKIKLSFVAGKNFCQIDMTKNDNKFWVKEIRIFEDNKADDKNLTVKVCFRDYRPVENMATMLPFSIDVEYYTVAGTLLIDNGQYQLGKRLQRKDSIRVNDIKAGKKIYRIIEIPKDSVIHNANSVKTMQLN